MRNPFTPFYGLMNIHTLKSLRKMETLSGLSFIQVENPSNPAPLLQQWLNEANQNNAQTSLMNLATATKNGKVSNRTVVIRDIISDGCLVFTAQAKSNKIKDILENPQVAATILLRYLKENKNVSKQIRFVGTAVELSKDQCRVYYEQEKLPAKIRSWICQNCGSTDWNELKSKHDALLREVVENQKVLEMPENQVAYKIVPSDIDFYFSSGDEIADRILFRKTETGEWKYERLAA